MKNLKYLSFALGVAIWSFGIAPARAAPADLQFNQVVDDFVFGSLALSPVTASTVGYHRHHGEMLEDQLDDFSEAGIKAQIRLQRDIEGRIERLDAKALSQEQRADIEQLFALQRAHPFQDELVLESRRSFEAFPDEYILETRAVGPGAVRHRQRVVAGRAYQQSGS